MPSGYEIAPTAASIHGQYAEQGRPDADRVGQTWRAAIFRQSLALDALNAALADVRGGLGPFLAIYLISARHWGAEPIGIVLTAGGIATVLALAPAGALVDAAHWKRALIVIATAVVGVGAVAMAVWPQFWPVVVAQSATGIADAVFPAAIAAISLGLVGRAAFAHRIGRNEAFNHAGNVVTAVLAGLAGYLIAPVAVLWIVAVLAAVSIAAALAIPGAAIDHDLARGADEDGKRQTPSPFGVLFECRPLLMFTAAITLFHFANAAMLPLVGEKLTRAHQAALGPVFMAACITTAQAVMVPAAVLCGRQADRWGRKPLFLVGFAVLPLRGVLFTLSSDPYYLVAVQVLDGIGAGIFGALFPIVVADLTKGTGRYNLAQGAASACWGLGAALSNAVAGVVAERLGFSAAFLCLAAVAAAAVLLFGAAVPETRGFDARRPAASARGLSGAVAS